MVSSYDKSVCAIANASLFGFVAANQLLPSTSFIPFRSDARQNEAFASNTLLISTWRQRAAWHVHEAVHAR